MSRDPNGESPYSGANALLQATAALNKATAASEGVERVIRLQKEDIQRVARAGENALALMETEVRNLHLAYDRAVEAFEKVPVALAVLAASVQLAATQSTEAKTAASEAGKAAREHTDSFRRIEANAPRDEMAGDTEKWFGKAGAFVVRRWKTIVPWVATAGLGIWHLVEKLAHLIK